MKTPLEQAMERKDYAIRQLWVAYRDLSDFMVSGDYEMTDKDMFLWGKVTEHEAVQSKLQSK